MEYDYYHNRVVSKAVGGAVLRLSAQKAIDAGITYALRIASDGENYFNSSAATLDSFLNFSRNGSATYIDQNSDIQTAATDELRYEYRDGKKYILLENAATNLVTNSSDLGSYSVNGGTLTLMPEEVAPDGSTGSVYRLQLPVAGATYLSVLSATATTDHCISVYVKKYQADSDFNLYLRSSEVSERFSATDHWERYSYFAGGNNGVNGINNGDDTYPVDILIWGVQIEAGTKPTSYIATTGAAVTRAADIAWCDISALNLGDGYTVYAEFILDSVKGDYDRIIQLDTGSNNDRAFAFYQPSSGKYKFQLYDGNVFQAAGEDTSGLQLESEVSLAARISLNDFNAAYNGNTLIADTSATYQVPAYLYLSSQDVAAVAKPARLLLADLRIYDTPLTDAELAEVTAL